LRAAGKRWDERNARVRILRIAGNDQHPLARLH
jgi:hypothetical protein